jgi:hypothetical protein
MTFFLMALGLAQQLGLALGVPGQELGLQLQGGAGR